MTKTFALLGLAATMVACGLYFGSEQNSTFNKTVDADGFVHDRLPFMNGKVVNFSYKLSECSGNRAKLVVRSEYLPTNTEGEVILLGTNPTNCDLTITRFSPLILSKNYQTTQGTALVPLWHRTTIQGYQTIFTCDFSNCRYFKIGTKDGGVWSEIEWQDFHETTFSHADVERSILDIRAANTENLKRMPLSGRDSVEGVACAAVGLVLITCEGQIIFIGSGAPTVEEKRILQLPIFNKGTEYHD